MPLSLTRASSPPSALVPSALLQRADELVASLPECPIVELPHPGIRLFAQQEQMGLVGSIKDRPALWILRSAIARGEIGPDSVIVESSSGNFAMALAAFCKRLNLTFVPVIDPNIQPANEAFLRSHCAQVEKVSTTDETGGYLRTRVRRVAELLQKTPRAFWTNQYANLDGMDSHYRFTAQTACTTLSQLDYVFVGVSSAGTIAGVSRRLKERFPSVRVIAVDAEGSIIFGGEPKPRRIPGIGASLVPSLLQYAQVDDVVKIPEEETIQACHTVLARHNLFVGGSTGSVFAAIERYMVGERTRETPSVLFFCADRGSAYRNTIYDPSWVETFEKSE